MSSYVMFVLSYFVATVNSSVNSVVYGIFSKKYRKVFLEHFCPKKPVQAEIHLSSVISNKPILTYEAKPRATATTEITETTAMTATNMTTADCTD